MKMKKVTAMLAALLMACGTAAGATADINEDFEFEDDTLKGTTCGDGCYSFDVISEKEHVSVKESYDGVQVEEIEMLSGKNTKYLTLPDGCSRVLQLDCEVLEGLYVPDSIKDFNFIHTTKNLTLIGSRRSIAKIYAMQKDLDYVLLGDTNNDGKVGVADIVGQMQYLTGDLEFDNGILKMAADIKHDGLNNILDLIQTKKAILADDDKPTDLAAPYYNNSGNAPVPAMNQIKAFTDYVAEYSDDVLLNTKDENKDSENQKYSNMVYSPLSVYMAVSVLAECCDGESEAALLKYLNVENKEELQNINHDIFESLYFDHYDTYLKINNSVWIDDKYLYEPYRINSEKADILAAKYYASSFVRDFADQSQCNEMSDWISENTSGKFKPKFEADNTDQEVMKIINTITFKDSWRNKFSDDGQKEFKTAGGDTVETKFMYDKNGGTLTLDEDFAAYTKSFDEKYRMTFVLPEEGKEPADLLENKETMQNVLAACTGDGVKNVEVKAYIPEFGAKSKFELADTMEKAGLSRIFNECADLEPIVEGIVNKSVNPPVVSKVTHEAVIDVDTDGCEAAAYTAIKIEASAAPMREIPEIYEFRCDRPFIYYISDHMGTPFFMGIVNDPTQK